MITDVENIERYKKSKELWEYCDSIRLSNFSNKIDVEMAECKKNAVDCTTKFSALSFFIYGQKNYKSFALKKSLDFMLEEFFALNGLNVQDFFAECAKDISEGRAAEVGLFESEGFDMITDFFVLEHGLDSYAFDSKKLKALFGQLELRLCKTSYWKKNYSGKDINSLQQLEDSKVDNCLVNGVAADVCNRVETEKPENKNRSDEIFNITQDVCKNYFFGNTFSVDEFLLEKLSDAVKMELGFSSDGTKLSAEEIDSRAKEISEYYKQVMESGRSTARDKAIAKSFSNFANCRLWAERNFSVEKDIKLRKKQQSYAMVYALRNLSMKDFDGTAEEHYKKINKIDFVIRNFIYSQPFANYNCTVDVMRRWMHALNIALNNQLNYDENCSDDVIVEAIIKSALELVRYRFILKYFTRQYDFYANDKIFESVTNGIVEKYFASGEIKLNDDLADSMVNQCIEVLKENARK